MRINKVQLAGLAVALAGVAAGPAKAEDVTISTATTTPLSTSDPVAGGAVAAGDVTIASGGTITITTGQTAVTVDSSNDVTIQTSGRIAGADQDNVTGIALEGGNTGTINNAGAITFLDGYTQTNADTDTDLDGPFTDGENKVGIWLQSGSAFVGEIVNSGTITIEGNNSYGIRLDALLDSDVNLDGSLTTSGVVNVLGDDSIAIAIQGGPTAGLAGDALIRGGVTAQGENVTGLLVDAPIGGELRIAGSWQVTGYRYTTRPSDTSNLDADDLLQGGSAVHVRSSVAGGITVEGLGVENDGDANVDDYVASIAAYGQAPAILIEADPSGDLDLGATTNGYGLVIRGSVTAAGIYDGVAATGLRLVGNSGAAEVNTADGVQIDGTVTAISPEGISRAVHIGAFTNIDDLNVRGTVTGISGSDDLGDDAYAIYLDSGANVPDINNRGIIRARILGEQSNATAIYDAASSVQNIYNSGSIVAQAVATDEDPTDDVLPPTPTGDTIAIDLRNSTNNVLIWQRDLGAFTDDDAVDDVDDPDILIQGDILLGSGSDTIQLDAGDIIGDIDFDAGANIFNIDNGATFSGGLSNTGSLAIVVTDGALNHGGGATSLTSAYFDANSTLGITLSETAGQSTALVASGVVEFVDGAVIVPVIPIGLPVSSGPGDYIFLTANGGLVGEEFVVGDITGDTVPYLYNMEIAVASGDPNSLEAIFAIKTANELGLTSNQTSAFAPLLDALRRDDAASLAFASLLGENAFFDAYEDLMPSYSSAAAEIATTAIQQMQGATGNRLAATRLQGLDEVSIWAQEIGYAVTRTPPTPNGQEFDGNGFGIAVGIDGPLESGDLFGLSASFLASEVEEAGRPEGEIASWFGQVNAYMGAARGPIDLDFIAGLGAGKTQSRRFVEIGDDFSAVTEGDWWAFEGHASARASAPMRMADWFILTPQVGLTYVALSEQAYTEEGGGAAVDYDVDSAFSQRLWADAGVELSGRFNLGSRNVIAPRLFVGYRANVIDEEAERTVRFVSGGDDFTLIDEGLGDGGPIVGIGVDASNGYSTFSLGYEGEFGDQIERHSINAAIRFRF
jgi:uncharacterized protein with beta-barrel porin domain